MLPALYGNGKAQNGFLDGPVIGEFRKICEVFEIAADGSWSFRADICPPDRIRLFDGELLDMLTAHFRAIMNLKYFHEGRFYLEAPLSPAKVNSAEFGAEVIAMCSTLAISIQVHAGAARRAES